MDDIENNNIMLSIINNLSKNLSIPVTCKIRLPLFDHSKGVNIAKQLENAGASLLCIHGRTRLENKNKCGPSDWDAIKNIKSNVNIPVLANGSMESIKDIQNCIEYTNVEGVALGESLLEFPTLLSNNNCAYNDNNERKYQQQIDVAMEYLELVELYYTDHWRLHLYKILHSHFSILNSTNIGENNKGNQLRTNLSKCKTINDGKEFLNELTILMNNYEYGDTTIKKEMSYYYRYRKNELCY